MGLYYTIYSFWYTLGWYLFKQKPELERTNVIGTQSYLIVLAMMTLHQFGSIFYTCCEWVIHLLKNYKSMSTNNGNFRMISIVLSICTLISRYNSTCWSNSLNLPVIQYIDSNTADIITIWHIFKVCINKCFILCIIANIYQTLNEYMTVKVWCLRHHS